MFEFWNRAAKAPVGVLNAISKALAIIEFKPDGTILTANENFCATMGYTASQIIGRHHSMFVEPSYAASDEYRAFWAKLNRGEFDGREYKRLGKNGKEVWIQASYSPVVGAKGQVLKIVKVATDITADKLRNAEFEGKINAISRAQAIIEFLPDGSVASANANFLSAVGYTLEEVVGRHHKMFVDPAEANTEAYRNFWRRLNDGEFIAAEFRRIGRGGAEIWINASYNPVFDLNGKVYRIVKYATVVTDRVNAVKDIQVGLTHLANNDLVYRLDRSLNPDFEPVRVEFNASIQGLEGAMSRVSSSAYAIQSGAQEIAGAADDLSRRTERQAATLEETAAALDEVTATVRQTAEGAQQATFKAGLAREDAVRSGEVMSEAVAAIDQIEQSAQQISQIIGVIDEIAFQTSLLALNAGVEAARAGDAGRGFAVVAQEVRALAQRSAQAAKEIKTLIGASTKHVSRGVELVRQTGVALSGIATKVSDMDALIAQIAGSASEQASSLVQVNTAINQMDQVTQQNAAMVEEVSAAVASLQGEADGMADLVRGFRTSAPDGSFKSGGHASEIRAERGRVVALRAGGRSAVGA